MSTVYVVFYLGEPTCVALTEGEAIRLVKENNPGTSVYRELPFFIPDDGTEVKIIAGPIPNEEGPESKKARNYDFNCRTNLNTSHF